MGRRDNNVCHLRLHTKITLDFVELALSSASNISICSPSEQYTEINFCCWKIFTHRFRSTRNSKLSIYGAQLKGYPIIELSRKKVNNNTTWHLWVIKSEIEKALESIIDLLPIDWSDIAWQWQSIVIMLTQPAANWKLSTSSKIKKCSEKIINRSFRRRKKGHCGNGRNCYRVVFIINNSTFTRYFFGFPEKG